MPQTRQSSVLSLEAEGSDDSDSSDDDVPLAERLVNLAQARKDRGGAWLQKAATHARTKSCKKLQKAANVLKITFGIVDKFLKGQLF